MQATICNNFREFQQELAQIVSSAYDVDDLCAGFIRIHFNGEADGACTVAFIIDPADSTFELHVCRPDDYYARLTFDMDEYRADDSGFTLYKTVMEEFRSFMFDENPQENGASLIERELRLQIVADLNDLLEGYQEFDSRMVSFSLEPDSNTILLINYLPINQELVAAALRLSNDYEVVTLALGVPEYLERFTETTLAMRIVSELTGND